MALDPLLAALLRLGVLAAGSIVFGQLLRVARFPGGLPACVLGGAILAGVLLGPSVLGAIRPDLLRALTAGAHAELRQEIADLEAEHRAELAVLREIGVTDIALDELAADHAGDLAPLEERLEQAEQDFARPMHIAAVALVAMAALAGTAFRPPALEQRLTHPEAIALAVILSAVFVALPVSVVLGWVFGISRLDGVLIGLAALAGSLVSGPVLRSDAITAGTRGARLWLVGAALLTGGLLIGLLPGDGWLWVLPVVMALLVGVQVKPGVGGPPQGAILWLLVAPACAHLVATIDLAAAVGSIGTIVFILAFSALAGMGHWLGIGLALKTTGYAPLNEQGTSASAVWLDWMSRGVMLSVPLWLVVLEAAGDPAVPDAVALALVLASLSFEAWYGVSRRMLATMDSIERDLDQPDLDRRDFDQRDGERRDGD